MNTEIMTQQLDIFCNLELIQYFDEACLSITNLLNESIRMFKQIDLCYKCVPQFWINIDPLDTVDLIVPINAVTTITSENVEDKPCVNSYQFELHGLYSYNLDLTCDYIHVLAKPGSIFFDLLIFLNLFVIAWLFFFLLRYFDVVQKLQFWLKKLLYEKKSSEPTEDVDLKEIQTRIASEVEISKRTIADEETNVEKVIEYASRGVNTSDSVEEIEDVEPMSIEFVEFEALLAFRGLIISLWVFFNVEGQTLTFLQKSPWDGLKMYDLRIGWFYWALAASFYLHFHLSMSQGQGRIRILLRGVLLRSAIYFMAGLCYNQINNTSRKGQDFQPQFPPITELRVFGFLQRVGLAQLVTSTVEVCVMVRTVKQGPVLQDLRDSWVQWLVCGVLVGVHTSITYLLPIPVCPTGYIGPGGLCDNSHAVKCTGGIAQYIDQQIVGKERMLPVRALERGQCVYKISNKFDPEGLLGTLTTCFMMTLAMQASRIFIYFNHGHNRIIRLLCWAIVQLLLGGILCNFQQHDGLVPINVYLMSISYVLVTSGIAYLVLLALYLLINVWRMWSGFPFIYSGINILVVFYGSLLFHHTFPFTWEVPWYRSDSSLEYLIVAGWCVCVWNYVCYQLIKHRTVCPI